MLDIARLTILGLARLTILGLARLTILDFLALRSDLTMPADVPRSSTSVTRV